MYKSLIVVITLLLASGHAGAQMAADGRVGSGSKAHEWNVPTPEKLKALTLPGDVEAGRQDYQAYCQACHLPNAAGNPDGSIPRLAGQHTTVIIKQLADIRSGLRANPTMYPFAGKLADAQALADVAAYLGTLCVPRDSAQYQGPDAARLIAYGKVLYDKQCVQCHQPNGDGVKEKLYPLIAGQHYQYLLRQMLEIRNGQRGNSHPDMIRAIAGYNDAQLLAIAAYQATLSTQARSWASTPRFCEAS
ncbi:c-type cytochrome [Candidatus Accumulibacter sp. ACC003]|uniref:c-type cytochrome n=1 Tax=Candidatus Accumulibacter sp. ACC003 TaxID=2823334 RepID=UPI0025BDFB7E|nr:c-type cytochrome [Candidatus Accumulibacter sp. ACC003]